MVLEERLIKLFNDFIIDVRSHLNDIDDIELKRTFLTLLNDYRNRMENLNEDELV
jgi:hypothetical protein